MANERHIVVTTSTGDTYHGTLEGDSVTLTDAPRAAAGQIARQMRDGQDRGQVERGGIVFAWHVAEVFVVRQASDGTWYVVDTVENVKTHHGYFKTLADAEAERNAIFAEAAGLDRLGRNTRVA
jgi:hypothetical protein